MKNINKNKQVAKSNWCFCPNCRVEDCDIDALCCKKSAALNESKFEG